MALSPALSDVLNTARGRHRRRDAALPRTGGPAGNARLTAWLGLTLLVLLLAELLTLINVTGLITWHLAIGLLLIPPAVAKTATTGWRVVRYYTGHAHYTHAGPPPLLLRILGPFVVLATLAVLGSGVLLIGLGPTATFRPWFAVLNHDISPLTLHQVSFIFWAITTGLHVLARTIPAVYSAVLEPRDEPPLAGRRFRALTLVLAASAAVVLMFLVLDLSTAWTQGDIRGNQSASP
jgi:hypothetical protein